MTPRMAFSMMLCGVLSLIGLYFTYRFITYGQEIPRIVPFIAYGMIFIGLAGLSEDVETWLKSR